MAKSGVCCGRLKEPKALMKFGLSVVLIGHVNFLLAALVHGAVLRHINLNPTARGMEYAISNVLAMVAGLVGVIIGIMAIVLSKNNSRRALSTTLILWFPLIGMSVVQLVYSSWCMSACSSFLGLSCCCSCCPRHKPPREITRPHVRGQHNERQARPAEQHELLAQPQPPPRSLLRSSAPTPTPSQPNRASQLSRDSFWI
ncbi:transmembrane protein 54b isoform X3 [Sardina pilchardus]|uniref:transmembrane protein 54b isoform X3 n=1 Tax=Sardina pilchardus TaxID=27697 RepID=UPI002E13374D